MPWRRRGTVAVLLMINLSAAVADNITLEQKTFAENFVWAYHLRLNITTPPAAETAGTLAASAPVAGGDVWDHVDEFIEKSLKVKKQRAALLQPIDHSKVSVGTEAVQQIARTLYEKTAGSLISKWLERLGQQAGRPAGRYLGCELGLAMGILFPEVSVPLVIGGVLAGDRIGAILGKYAGEMLADYTNEIVEDSIIDKVAAAAFSGEDGIAVAVVVRQLTGQEEAGAQLSHCLPGTWGQACDQKCPSNCALSFLGCAEDGGCLGYPVGQQQQDSHCSPGYHGKNCSRFACGPLGYVCPDGKTPQPCPPGQYGQVSGFGVFGCSYCGRGSYTADYGSTRCVRCKIGYQCEYTDREQTDPCPPGTFGTTDGYGRPGCLSCGRGSYSTAPASLSCSTCPLGYTCDRADRAPVPCPPGTYGTTDGYGIPACGYCTKGTCAPAPASLKCNPCPPGLADDLVV